jgi:hypothetical protein
LTNEINNNNKKGLTKSETNKWIEFVNRIEKAMEFEINDKFFSLFDNKIIIEYMKYKVK